MAYFGGDGSATSQSRIKEKVCKINVEFLKGGISIMEALSLSPKASHKMEQKEQSPNSSNNVLVA